MRKSRRPHRHNFNEPGHAHELTFSCYRRYPFLKGHRVCEWLVMAIDEARVRFETDIWAFVFMPEHVHLIVRPRRPNYDMAEIRRAIKEPVGRKALRYVRDQAPEWEARLTRHRGKRVEHLFWQSGGGYDRNVTEPGTLLAMIEYLHLNPVRRGLVERAVDWYWSSAAYYEGVGQSPLTLDPLPPDWATP